MSIPAADPVLTAVLAGLWRGGRPVLGPVSLALARGETLAITGPSGIGKTSLLRTLAGLERGYEGQIRRPARMAVVFQEPTLLPWRTLRHNLCLAADIDARAADAALSGVGLAGMGDRYPGQVSLGQQRRLALARAFASRPEVLLMDEPFVSLDKTLADEMMTLFQRLRDASGVATVLVTHSDAEAGRLADRVLRLEGHPARLAG